MNAKCEHTGKVKHATQGAAYAHARSLSGKRKGLVFPYICRRCNAWHVGHFLHREKPNL